jgi:hypothetical protein
MVVSYRVICTCSKKKTEQLSDVRCPIHHTHGKLRDENFKEPIRLDQVLEQTEFMESDM